MKNQLNRIERKLDALTISVEHRLTRVETTQRGIKWLIGIIVAIAIPIIIVL